MYMYIYECVHKSLNQNQIIKRSQAIASVLHLLFYLGLFSLVFSAALFQPQKITLHKVGLAPDKLMLYLKGIITGKIT